MHNYLIMLQSIFRRISLIWLHLRRIRFFRCEFVYFFNYFILLYIHYISQSVKFPMNKMIIIFACAMNCAMLNIQLSENIKNLPKLISAKCKKRPQKWRHPHFIRKMWSIVNTWWNCVEPIIYDNIYYNLVQKFVL